MKIFLIFFSYLIINSFYSVAEADEYRVCALNFEIASSPITKAVIKTFKNAKNVDLTVAASPLDLLGCVRGRYSEILIIGHALQTPANVSGRQPVNLAYFRNLTGEDRSAVIQNMIGRLNIQLQNTTPDTDEYAALLGKIEKLQNFSSDKPYYVIRPILPQAFRVVREELSRQAKSADGISLKKFRLMSCLPNEVLAEYDDLREMLSENAVTLDIAPKNSVLSALEGEIVTSPSPKWLSQSIHN